MVAYRWVYDPRANYLETGISSGPNACIEYGTTIIFMLSLIIWAMYVRLSVCPPIWGNNG